MDDWELWGTCSVRDHLARNAFVAEVLLFDRLVVPVPPAGDETEEKERWRKDWDSNNVPHHAKRRSTFRRQIRHLMPSLRASRR